MSEDITSAFFGECVVGPRFLVLLLSLGDCAGRGRVVAGSPAGPRGGVPLELRRDAGPAAARASL